MKDQNATTAIIESLSTDTIDLLDLVNIVNKQEREILRLRKHVKELQEQTAVAMQRDNSDKKRNPFFVMTKNDEAKPLVSLVVPIYNEGEHILANLQTILKSAQTQWYDLELIAVDDGSRDESQKQISMAATHDKRIRLISFTRNFGKEAAIQAGLADARGAVAVILDSDLQHPPELIPRMISIWRQGILIVEARKQDRRNECLTNRLYAKLFYSVFQYFSGFDINGQSDFKLIDRKVIDTYLSLPEKVRFFRGLVHWTSYPSIQIYFLVPQRVGGTSRWSRIKLLRYAINNITNFSSAPLQIVSIIGFLTLIIGTLFGAISLFQKINGHSIDGFTTVILLLVIIGGAILMGLGIIGHYIARLYDEVKARPAYIIK
ncbi:glycosyltransferase family 2 protein [Polaromonas glacialis]|uniref:glycosyltransferase family 2 protein n=1 Tax=Polaromonas glacialis TaxID=866564 RepID=UPI000A07AD7F|nr:glycosyltransferase family 2 protein [Polaromonas glacialis]